MLLVSFIFFLIFYLADGWKSWLLSWLLLAPPGRDVGLPRRSLEGTKSRFPTWPLLYGWGWFFL